MTLKIALCGESKKEMAHFRAMLAESPPLKAAEHTVAEFFDGMSLLSALENDPRCFDIIFLDPQLSKKCGHDLPVKIRCMNNLCSLIFASHNEEYAIAGYKVFAVGYMLEPFNQKDLDLFSGRAIHIQTLGGREKHAFLKTGHEYISVSSANLVFAESNLKYIYLHLSDGTVHKILMPIDRLLEVLEDKCFIKTHKSFIANMNYITAAAPYEFAMGSFGSVSITQRKYPQIKRAYMDFVGSRVLESDELLNA